ncbi:winged helix DNA-binding protein [Sphingomonas sp.]|uniref:winged helix DNA-binding protein n=1 Tax=Sphingomonas sp. TaxID=28214 RepID=UPI003B00E04C
MNGERACFLPDAKVDPASIRYDDARPSALVFADDEERRERLTAIAAGRGLRAVAKLPIAEAAARLAYQVSGLVILEVAADGGVAFDRLLDHVEDAAGTGAGTIVIASEGMIDLVARGLGIASTALLIAPEDEEIGAAIDELLAPREAVLADSASDAANGRRLRELSEEVGRIARTLASLSAGADAMPGMTVEPRSVANRLQIARAEIRVRRLRDQFFDPSLFADPAWDMLLDLAAADLERRRVAVSSLCIAAAVPATTALRWIAQMTEQGLLARYPDPDDGRRVFITLTEAARSGMSRYLDACATLRG